ncbi:alpha/beta hydrolase fold domain-containing protein [Klenkia terrae]|uniref:alpha/beta hydrolase fold domain-containing protein n=1 Tax=Klenkia terrae TaxID=1052259 RepID=UPI003623AD29
MPTVPEEEPCPVWLTSRSGRAWSTRTGRPGRWRWTCTCRRAGCVPRRALRPRRRLAGRAPDRLRRAPHRPGRAGVAVASIDYRTVDLAAWPAQGHDVLAAAAWLREHADELGVSGDPVVLMGSSAGAHVVTLTALSSPSPDVAGIVALFGRHDLAATAPKPAAHLEVPAVIRADAPPAGFEHLDQRGKLALLAGVPVADLTAERLAELSPVHHAGPDAPPVFLAHGTADALVHHSHALRLAGALADAPSRSEVTLVLVPGANHEDDAFADPRFLGSVAAFVDRCTAPLTSSAR